MLDLGLSSNKNRDQLDHKGIGPLWIWKVFIEDFKVGKITKVLEEQSKERESLKMSFAFEVAFIFE